MVSPLLICYRKYSVNEAIKRRGVDKERRTFFAFLCTSYLFYSYHFPYHSHIILSFSYRNTGMLLEYIDKYSG